MQSYIILQILLPLTVSFIISALLVKKGIPVLKRFKFGQYEREDGPESHKFKEGTPTMGGIMFLIAFIIVCIPYMVHHPNIIAVLISTVLFGLVGFLDDYLKIKHKENEGLTPVQKMAGQAIAVVIVLLYLRFVLHTGTDIVIPFLGRSVDLGIWYYLLAAFMLLGTVNGSNFTDGLDGLSSSVTCVISAFFAVMSYIVSADIEVSCMAFLGSLLGFLMFNSFKADIFMGDTGALALGGFAASAALIMKNPLIVIIVCFIYFIEVVSVIIQVAVFQLFHKRFFKMAPIHHHFEKCGMRETQVVMLFTTVTIILCVIGLIAL